MNTTQDVEWLKFQLKECEQRLESGPVFPGYHSREYEIKKLLENKKQATDYEKQRLKDLLADRASDNIGLRNIDRWRVALEQFTKALRNRIAAIEGGAQ
jgi:hypothetical protein